MPLENTKCEKKFTIDINYYLLHVIVFVVCLMFCYFCIYRFMQASVLRIRMELIFCFSMSIQISLQNVSDLWKYFAAVFSIIITHKLERKLLTCLLNKQLCTRLYLLLTSCSEYLLLQVKICINIAISYCLNFLCVGLCSVKVLLVLY